MKRSRIIVSVIVLVVLVIMARIMIVPGPMALAGGQRSRWRNTRVIPPVCRPT